MGNTYFGDFTFEIRTQLPCDVTDHERTLAESKTKQHQIGDSVKKI